MNKFFTLCLVISALFLLRCSSNNENKQSESIDTLAKANALIVAEAEKIIKAFPTPFEITQLLNKAGATYILDISNTPGNVDKYTTTESRALNLGIYGADLCYAATYNKKQEVTNYIAAVQKICEKIEIANVYDKITNDRINKNFDKKDSIVNICSKQISITNEALINSGRSNISAFSITGGVVEGIFLSTQLASFAKDNSKIKKVISEQKDTFKKLILLLSQYKDNKDIQDIALKLKDLDLIFDNIKGTMSNEQLIDLSAKVENLRKDFIK
jgi:hypothetical protein